ncbi:hypothetical protein G9U56_00035 (plasmid) [Weissella paramesenteroides]|nr:hypothetical protein [Weissella paramesenteroides]MDF8373941.1 hypothetical protein [Weissella paramesenteroides]WIG65443.1 hypothetical protein G9U56_00035 [Weissella paramesenteroides]
MAQGKAHLNLIDKAHQNGYEVTLLYVAVNSVKTAIKRVNETIPNGENYVSWKLKELKAIEKVTQ